ncbi:triacylglycerol lipase [Frankia sp. CNm7]|uniref:Triacylglycerol lipase n=1 Tax=Frankia nepalensis TaxID=1836974 RepID=A0A937RS62_9ACTN|nr:triacylglycerol lipase [Frankia nepalensis]MBL7510450.1 triacylglycerol lipase [Frankia nepalensis]MBL7524842.1 triacylglycerol lipase [Frankia nepalensis]MBL7630956.1 triacylglycerol lipase [Frankia nepalensis]
MVALLALVLAGCGGSSGKGKNRDGDDAAAPAVPGGNAGAPAYTGPTRGAAGDSFYRPADPLPAGKPGDVLSYRTVPAPAQLASLGATVYQVLYLSTDALGKPAAVSGTIVLPGGVDVSKAPVLSYAAGSHGIGDRCAPSKGIADGSDYGLDEIAAAARHGWVVAATDYQGLGTPGEHTYVVGRAEGHAVIDAARAALRLPGAHPAANAKVAYWGYSQGGGAAAWAGELTATYAPELALVGVAAGGVPADLAEVSKVLEGSQQVGLQFMAAVGFDAAYPELRLDSFLTPAGRTAIDALRAGCLDAIAGLAGKGTADIATINPLSTAVWQKRLAENKLGSAPPSVPLFLYHGTKDVTVAYPQGEALMRAYCAKGATVTWQTFDGDHGAGTAVAPAALDFLTARYANLPTPNTC